MAFSGLTDLQNSLIDAARHHQIGCEPVSEVLFCLSGDGRSIIDAEVGAKDKVNLTCKMKEYMGDNQVSLIHNHPSEGSISSSDWRLCINNKNICEIIAVNSHKSYFRGKILKYDRFQEIIDCFKCVMQNIQFSIKADYSCCDCNGVPPNICCDQYDYFAVHFINEYLSKINIIGYYACFGSFDQDLLKRTPMVNFKETAENELSKHFL